MAWSKAAGALRGTWGSWGPGVLWWARHTYIFTDVFFDVPRRDSMCIEQGPSLPLKLRALGGRGAPFSPVQ